jgi:hypothetical protein
MKELGFCHQFFKALDVKCFLLTFCRQIASHDFVLSAWDSLDYIWTFVEICSTFPLMYNRYALICNPWTNLRRQCPCAWQSLTTSIVITHESGLCCKEADWTAATDHYIATVDSITIRYLLLRSCKAQCPPLQLLCTTCVVFGSKNDFVSSTSAISEHWSNLLYVMFSKCRWVPDHSSGKK